MWLVLVVWGSESKVGDEWWPWFIKQCINCHFSKLPWLVLVVWGFESEVG
ncbi:hypothetical protein Hdeb2414_s0016g00491111 [Helianthus debilis subsp. tardiflorus]